ncbi:MAG: hypothetical protein ABIB71_04645 [Candidatus Woesearchaeota archaeon]
MGLIRRVKEISHMLGLTREKRKEISRVYYQKAEVEEKKYWQDPFMPTADMYADEHYSVRFNGDIFPIEVENEDMFNGLKEGDMVLMGFKKVYSCAYDYIPPDFGSKELVDMVVSGHEFISAKKL